jgi:hypothetical protein
LKTMTSSRYILSLALLGLLLFVALPQVVNSLQCYSCQIDHAGCIGGDRKTLNETNRIVNCADGQTCYAAFLQEGGTTKGKRGCITKVKDVCNTIKAEAGIAKDKGTCITCEKSLCNSASSLQLGLLVTGAAMILGKLLIV